MGVEGRRVLAVAALTLVCCSPSTETTDVDLLILGGRLVDGSGSVPHRADLAIREGRVVEIGSLAGLTAKRRLDARGRIVAPGFIDLHSHADLVLLDSPARQAVLLEAKLRQGVTTVIVGNCGLGVAPTDAVAAEILSPINRWMTPEGVEAGPSSVEGYLDRLERQGTALNVGTLVPHGAVRISAMGPAGGRPSDTQLERMRAEVERGLVAGAFGLSVGLIYPPGMYSDTEELVLLAEVVARHDRLFTSHVRGSSETLLDATAELMSIAERSGARVHHSHMEAVGEPFWEQVPAMIEMEDRARGDGLRVSHDVFPYTRAATMMTAIFPPWALEGGVPNLLSRLRDPEERARIRREIETRKPHWPPWVDGGWPHNLVGAVGWDGIVVASVGAEGSPDPVGQSLARLAEQAGEDPFDVVVELLLETSGAVGQQVKEISGTEGRIDALVRILTHPAAAVVSDAEDYGRGAPHPAHAGAFARVLRLNREMEWMPVESLIRRMTGYPAELLGLSDRGILSVGAVADVVVLDATRVTDHADWENPRRFATGFDYVVVNGNLVVDRERFTPGAHGAVLRSVSSGSADAVLSLKRSPSGASASTRTIRREAVPSP